MTLTVQETKGSFDNLQGIIDNKFTAGIAQFDVMKFFEEKDPGMSRIKVLMPLHVEEIHIVGLNKSDKAGGVNIQGFNIGGRAVELNSIKDLAGKKVAAWGGSVLSADYFAPEAPGSATKSSICRLTRSRIWSRPRCSVRVKCTPSSRSAALRSRGSATRRPSTSSSSFSQSAAIRRTRSRASTTRCV